MKATETISGTGEQVEAGAGGFKLGTTIQDLDAFCLSEILMRLEDPSACALVRLLGSGFDMQATFETCRLGNLRASSLVCRQWLEMSNVTRKCLSLQGGSRQPNLSRLITRFPELTLVQLVDFRLGPNEDQEALPGASLGPTDGTPLALLASKCRGLLDLALVRCAVSDQDLAAVLESCPHLRTLCLDRCERFSGAAFDGLRKLRSGSFSCALLRGAHEHGA